MRQCAESSMFQSRGENYTGHSGKHPVLLHDHPQGVWGKRKRGKGRRRGRWRRKRRERKEGEMKVEKRGRRGREKEGQLQEASD